MLLHEHVCSCVLMLCHLTQVFKHVLGSDPEEDELVFHETDDSFYVGLGESRSRDYICVSSGPSSSLTLHDPLFLPIGLLCILFSCQSAETETRVQHCTKLSQSTWNCRAASLV